MPSWDQNEDDSDNDMDIDPIQTDEIVKVLSIILFLTHDNQVSNVPTSL